MTLTVNLNPCIDRSLTVKTFTRGGMNRVADVRQDAAGKGVNVSAALAALGIADVLAAGFNYAENGQIIEDYLNRLGAAHDFITVEGAVRLNVKVYEQDTGIMTEFNQPGAFVPEASVDALLAKINNIRADRLVLSGSRPQGVASDIYARIMEENEGDIILDTEGEALRLGLACKKHRPFLIKPNLFELESAFHVKLPARKDIAAFCKKVIADSGVRYICVSMGKEGAMLVSERKTCCTEALDIPARGVQGAGDSMVAGIIYALETNASRTSPDDLPEEEILRCAAAAASASVVLEGTQMCDLDGFMKMRGLVKVTEMPV